MRYEISLTGVSSKEELHSRIGEVLPCPEYYGRNLDALWDVLTDLPEGEVVFTDAAAAWQAIPRYMAALARLCEDAQAEYTGLRVSIES